jgi:mRNA interferase MazF
VDRLKRGDLVVVALPGDYGKPRPALIVQADLFNETHASVTVVPVTSTLVDAPLFRLTVEPSPGNGLRSPSQLMVDKVTTVSRARVTQTSWGQVLFLAILKASLGHQHAFQFRHHLRVRSIGHRNQIKNDALS